MGTAAEVERVSRSLTYASLGFGAVGVLAPGVFMRSYLMEVEPQAKMLVRMWAIANLGLAASSLGSDSDEERKQHLMLGAGISAGNAVAIAIAPGLPSKTGRMLGILTTAGFAAAALYGLSKAD